MRLCWQKKTPGEGVNKERRTTYETRVSLPWALRVLTNSCSIELRVVHSPAGGGLTPAVDGICPGCLLKMGIDGQPGETGATRMRIGYANLGAAHKETLVLSRVGESAG